MLTPDKIEQIKQKVLKTDVPELHEDTPFGLAADMIINATIKETLESQLKELQETTDEEMLLTDKEIFAIPDEQWSGGRVGTNALLKYQNAKTSLHYNAKLEALNSKVTELTNSLQYMTETAHRMHDEKEALKAEIETWKDAVEKRQSYLY
jgi:chromosome segregation ATPase